MSRTSLCLTLHDFQPHMAQWQHITPLSEQNEKSVGNMSLQPLLQAQNCMPHVLNGGVCIMICLKMTGCSCFAPYSLTMITGNDSKMVGTTWIAFVMAVQMFTNKPLSQSMVLSTMSNHTMLEINAQILVGMITGPVSTMRKSKMLLGHLSVPWRFHWPKHMLILQSARWLHPCVQGHEL